MGDLQQPTITVHELLKKMTTKYYSIDQESEEAINISNTMLTLQHFAQEILREKDSLNK